MSRTLDLLQAAYQHAGRDGVDAVVDPLDPRSNGSPPSLAPGMPRPPAGPGPFRRRDDHGIRAGSPCGAAGRRSIAVARSPREVSLRAWLGYAGHSLTR
jgi:hypothetical protein